MACTCQSGKALCSSCLQSVYERNKVSSVGPLYNPNGEYTLGQVDVFQKQFEKNIVEDINGGPLAEAVRKYPDFYDAVQEINSNFFNRPFIQQQLPNYPVLSKRLERGNITPLEFSAFIRESNYTPSTAIASSNAQGSRFLRELEHYYNGDFADSVMGGFCGLFANIFGAIDAFFDMVDSIDGLVQDVLGFLKKIKNIKDEVLAAFEAIKVKALIESIKEKIGEMVEKAIQKVCTSIANFDVSAITGPIPNPTPAQSQVAENVEKKKTALQEVCGDDNAKRIKEKVQALIDYAVGLFENPSIEEIMALIARICAMATGIEELFKKLKDPLNDFGNRYDEVFNTLSNASNRVTGEAIRAGAIRPLEEHRQNMINKARVLWEEEGNIPPVTEEERKALPSWSDLVQGVDPRLKIGKGKWWTSGKMEPKHEFWTEVDELTRVMLMRLHLACIEEEVFQGAFTLVSGYRSPEYNEWLRNTPRETFPNDVAKNSQHMSGKALDIQWPGFNSRSPEFDKVIDLARQIGFKGFGKYKKFLHIDRGPERSWDRR